MISKIIRLGKKRSVQKKIAFLALLPLCLFGFPYAARYILAFCWFHNREAWLYVFAVISKITVLGAVPLLFYVYKKNTKPMNREVFWSVVTLIGVISVTYSFVTLSSIPGAYPDMTSFMDEYLRSVIGDFIDAIVILYLCTLFIVIRFSKKSLLLLSVYVSALIAVALFFPTAINKCGYGTCVFDSVFFQLMFLVVTLLALLAAIFYFLHESTFKKWFKFSIFYVPTAAFLYAISPGDDGGWLAISTAGIVAVCSLMGFVAATVILILYHSYKMSGKEFMRAIAVLSMVAIGSYFIALKNNIF